VAEGHACAQFTIIGGGPAATMSPALYIPLLRPFRCRPDVPPANFSDIARYGRTIACGRGFDLQIRVWENDAK
jgi:hypothetical protein